jgi:outer membrane protein TolC
MAVSMGICRALALGASTVALSACATAIAERGFDQTAQLTAERIGQRPIWVRGDADAQAMRQTLDTLLANPLGPDEAVRVALINNRSLQIAYAGIGVGAADLAAASRPPNPSISFTRVAGGGGVEIEAALALDVLGLFTFPLVQEAEERRFEQTRLRTAHEILRVAAQTRRAYFNAIAARQSAEFIAQVRDAASAQAELAERMNRAGNFSTLDYAREQAFYADSAVRLARAQQRATAERERLTRLLGLWGDDLGFKLPERLADLPETLDAADGLEAKAVAERLDIRMARAEVDALRRSLGLTKAIRFINVLEAGPAYSRDAEGPSRTGFEIALEVPIFDFGESRVAKAENTYLMAVNKLAQTAVNARSEVREAYSAYRTTHDLARHYVTEIVPLRRRISEEMVLRYNGMLASVFELLADAREQIAAVAAAIEAQRDFWIADTDLKFALIAETGVSGPTGPGEAPRQAEGGS